METPGATIRSATGRWVLLVTVLGAALTFVDATVVAIALPRVVDELGAGVDGAVWVVTAYNLTLASLVLTAGVLGDRFGLRRSYLVGVGGFTAASVVCGAAPTIEVLVGARVAQGVFAALLTPASLALIHRSFRAEERSRAVGVWSGLTGVAGAVGPLLGGVLVEHADWRWAFLVNLPAGLLVLWATSRHIAPDGGREEQRVTSLDWRGAVLLSALLASGTAALMGVGGTAVVVALGVVAVLTAILLGLHLSRTPAPLVPPAFWHDRTLRGVTVATFLFYGALGVAFFMLPLLLQVGSGLSPVQAGSAQLPVTLLMLLFSGRVGSLMERTGATVLMVLGALLAACAMGWFSSLGTSAELVADVLLPASVLGVGLTLFVTPLTATALAAAPAHLVGLASGVNNAVARTGGLVAVALVPLVGGLSGAALTDPAAVADASRAVFLGAATLMVLTAVVVALGVPWRRPQPEAPEPATPDAVPRMHCSPSSPPMVRSGD